MYSVTSNSNSNINSNSNGTIYDYMIVCDSINNTPECIDRNKFIKKRKYNNLKKITLNLIIELLEINMTQAREILRLEMNKNLKVKKEDKKVKDWINSELFKI